MQVLRDMLDTLDVCSDSDEPFDYLKATLLGQFGKSKWQSYSNSFASPWKCRASSPVFSWGSSNSISFHARSGRSWHPHDSRSHYFELLRLPMEMQGLKPSVLMGKIKQHLLPCEKR
jgi:hypothetical protein